MWWSILIGYTFSILAGHLFTHLVVVEAWKRLVGGDNDVSALRGDSWFTEALSVLERTLYTASWQLGKPEFVAVWLALKVGGQWKRWSEDQPLGERKILGRAIYTIFLLGNGLSLLYAIVGASLIERLTNSEWLPAIALPLILIVGTLVLWLWAKDLPHVV